MKKKFKWCLKAVSRIVRFVGFKASVKYFSGKFHKKFQECFNGGFSGLLGYFKEIQREFQESFKYVSRVFQESF